MSGALYPVEFLDRFGTEFAPWTLEDSLAYTRALARAHYENFQVVSFLLPRRLHQDFYNVYSFCRWADDLGDEIGDRARSIELLAWWRENLEKTFAGDGAGHPVFVALRTSIARHSLEEKPFADLIRAFVQDQTKTRFATWEELIDYCAYSANPVGRLVLDLCGFSDEERRRLSDATCTALQLANFWQDVRRDWKKGRVYLPQDVMLRHGYSTEALAEDLASGRCREEFRPMMAELCDRTEALFVQGLPLVDTVDARLAVDLDLFSRGGLTVLELIRRQDYDVISHRPKVGKAARMLLLIQALRRRLFTPRRATEAKTQYG